ncbi:DUF3124 domain-containing protein [Seleniivibrio woodruffii]|uniref:DUF3124 domain-containing protein n=1 Tax=Seleniivibrio woodruffii TaxID=1078050 RepID=UPI0026EEC789|nr:DUF3124 domain-containing protein [Seleniivibrio woodruffii]
MRKTILLILSAVLFSATAYAYKGAVVYVPVYSHIYTGDQEKPFLLAVTISIRNTDMKNRMTIMSADYYGSNGKLISRYIPKAVNLNPLSSVRFVVKESDTAGGSGASFIVRWKSSADVTDPVIESVMIGAKTQQGISFTSRGVVLSRD